MEKLTLQVLFKHCFCCFSCLRTQLKYEIKSTNTNRISAFFMVFALVKTSNSCIVNRFDGNFKFQFQAYEVNNFLVL